jgi:hypothetical protein
VSTYKNGSNTSYKRKSHSSFSLREISNDPYFATRQTYNAFNGDVPNITSEPVLSDYGLPDNAGELVKQESQR